MKPSILRELTLYRFRYVISYGLLAILTTAVLLVSIGDVPNGLRDAEMNSAVASNSLNLSAPRAEDVVNLPYHLLQKLSISVGGLSPLSVRLPSVVLGLIACAAIAVTLHLWFRQNIATMALLLAATSTPFIAISRVGTAGVLYMLLLVLIMLSAALLTTRKRGVFVWKLLAVAAGLLLLYMPLGIYAIIAMMIAGILHPHVRYQIKRTAWWQYIIIALLAAALLAPIILASMNEPATLIRLLGMSELQSKLQPDALWASIKEVAKTLGYFNRPSVGSVIAPYLTLTFLLFVAFGLTRTIMDRHAARSYLLHLWLIISIPLLILNPTSFSLLFVPCVFLMAIGLETFMREWYTVFPRNPYARIGALIPVSLIILGLISASTSQYFYGFYYADTRAIYRPELRSVTSVLKPHIQTRLVVPTEQVAFYDILRSRYPQLSVSDASTADASTSRELVVLSSSGYSASGQPGRIVASSHRHDAVMLRIYDRTR